MIKVYNGRAEIENRIKEGKNTLRWDKTSCQRFEANQARLQMGVLAYNLLLMIRQFYVWGEDLGDLPACGVEVAEGKKFLVSHVLF